MFPLVPIAAALVQFAPMIAGWLAGPKAEDIAGKVVGIATTVTGQSDPKAAIAALQSSPDLAMQFQKAVLDQQAEIEKIHATTTLAELQADVQNTAAVNATMQVEAKAEHWQTYSWRPYVGFCYGTEGVLAVLIVMFAYIGVMFGSVKPEVLSYIPGMLGALGIIMGAQTTVLGVASYFRGKKQALEAAKAPPAPAIQNARTISPIATPADWPAN